MNVEAFVLCDCATDSFGKLNVLGAFDTISPPQMPAVYPSCAIAARIRFDKTEEGKHRVRITVSDEDGNKMIPPLNADLNVGVRDDRASSISNLILNLQRLKFEKYGEFTVNLAIDGQHIASVPLYVRPRQKEL